jgi:uncharacterized damage-inducible protein DinB
MSSPKSLLDEALEGWAYTRQGVIDEVRNLPASLMTFQPTPASRSLAELVIHIVESGLMMSGELSRPDGNFRRKSYAAFMKEYAAPARPQSKPGLLKLLKETHASGDRVMRAAGEILMLQQIVQFNGEKATRLSWMSHGIAHEEYHRGQIALYARLAGEVPALTKLIAGAG